MRVTGGRYRGRTVECPKGIIRPAMDRMRESLFAILGDLSGLSFLDLFSGSGVIGIEAASRGAFPVMLVEKDPGKRITIQKNISFVETEIRLQIMPVERFVKSWRQAFDFVFLDPPFRYDYKDELLGMLARSRLLKPGTQVLLHYPDEERRPERIGPLVLRDRREYGRSIVLFYEAEEPVPGPIADRDTEESTGPPASDPS